MPEPRKPSNNQIEDESKLEVDLPKLLSPETARAELLTLLRLLVREPPPDHDFATCPTCKRYGITSI
jgi:hypothetical protein